MSGKKRNAPIDETPITASKDSRGGVSKYLKKESINSINIISATDKEITKFFGTLANGGEDSSFMPLAKAYLKAMQEVYEGITIKDAVMLGKSHAAVLAMLYQNVRYFTLSGVTFVCHYPAVPVTLGALGLAYALYFKGKRQSEPSPPSETQLGLEHAGDAAEHSPPGENTESVDSVELPDPGDIWSNLADDELKKSWNDFAATLQRQVKGRKRVHGQSPDVSKLQLGEMYVTVVKDQAGTLQLQFKSNESPISTMVNLKDITLDGQHLFVRMIQEIHSHIQIDQHRSNLATFGTTNPLAPLGNPALSGGSPASWGPAAVRVSGGRVFGQDNERKVVTPRSTPEDPVWNSLLEYVQQYGKDYINGFKEAWNDAFEDEFDSYDTFVSNATVQPAQLVSDNEPRVNVLNVTMHLARQVAQVGRNGSKNVLSELVNITEEDSVKQFILFNYAMQKLQEDVELHITKSGVVSVPRNPVNIALAVLMFAIVLSTAGNDEEDELTPADIRFIEAFLHNYVPPPPPPASQAFQSPKGVTRQENQIEKTKAFIAKNEMFKVRLAKDFKKIESRRPPLEMAKDIIKVTEAGPDSPGPPRPLVKAVLFDEALNKKANDFLRDLKDDLNNQEAIPAHQQAAKMIIAAKLRTTQAGTREKNTYDKLLKEEKNKYDKLLKEEKNKYDKLLKELYDKAVKQAVKEIARRKAVDEDDDEIAE